MKETVYLYQIKEKATEILLGDGKFFKARNHAVSALNHRCKYENRNRYCILKHQYSFIETTEEEI